MLSPFTVNAKNHFLDKKQFKALLPSFKLLPCYSNKIYKARKFYFGGIFSSQQNELCSNQIMYSNGFSFFGIDGAGGVACLENGASIISINESYKLSRKKFYTKGLKPLAGIWFVVKSNFFVTPPFKSSEQLRNFAIRSYRNSLVNQLARPRARQDNILADRIFNSRSDYAISLSASHFCNFNNSNYTNCKAFIIFSTPFFKIQCLFNDDKKFFFPIEKKFNSGLNLNSNFYDLSIREESACAGFIRKIIWSKPLTKQFFFSNVYNFKNYLLSLKKLLPTLKPRVFLRFSVVSRTLKNAGFKKNKNFVNHKQIKGNYKWIYGRYLETFSSTTNKLILSSSRFSSNYNKKSPKKNNFSALNLIFRQLKNKSALSSSLNTYFTSLFNIYNSSVLKNFFLRDLQYKRYRTVPYRRSRLPRYYKSL